MSGRWCNSHRNGLCVCEQSRNSVAVYRAPGRGLSRWKSVSGPPPMQVTHQQGCRVTPLPGALSGSCPVPAREDRPWGRAASPPPPSLSAHPRQQLLHFFPCTAHGKLAQSGHSLLETGDPTLPSHGVQALRPAEACTDTPHLPSLLRRLPPRTHLQSRQPLSCSTWRGRFSSCSHSPHIVKFSSVPCPH